MRKIDIPENLIEDATIHGWITSLVFFARCKLLYHNNTIYAYNPRKLADMLHCSVGSIRHHIKVLSKENLITITNGNITFKKIAGKHKSSIIIKSTDTLKEITYKLYMKLLERNVRQQQWIIGKKAEARKIRKKGEKYSLRHLKAILRLEKKYTLEKPIRTDITLSLKNISSILGVSHKTATGLKKFIQNAGMAKFVNDIEKICDITREAFSLCRDMLQSKYGYVYWYKGSSYHPLPAKVVVNDYWDGVTIARTNKGMGTFLSNLI